MSTLAPPVVAPLALTSREQALATLLPLFQEHRTFLVTSHARPDGDAIGSALAAMHLLEAMGKQVTVVFADAIPGPFTELPGAERILSVLPEQRAEIGLVLECDCVGRTGFAQLPALKLINIDHHRSGTRYAAVNWIDEQAPAVGVMLYDLAMASGVAISPALASCLYAAVLTDTVGFTLPNVTASTFELACHLLQSGADAAAISEAVYFSQRESKLRLLGAALRKLHVVGEVAWSTITDADLAETGARLEDSDGIVQHLIAIEGVRAAALLRELPSGSQVRTSLRSKGSVDVAEVAESFGGGGHRNASGCTLEGPVEAAGRRMEAALRSACATAAPAAGGLVA